jgi:DNA polymerase-4
MSLKINTAESNIMHIDLNSAFATTEQQARPSLRGKPMGVTNRISVNCCVIACSYEAKALGIKVGMGLSEARAIYPKFIVLETDPPKYHFVYQKLVKIMQDYSPNIEMKSIDEGIIDFNGTREVNTRPLEVIGAEIKQRIKDEIGSWMKVNVGIAPNRFLSKQAASWHKPNGLDVLEHRNLLDYYKTIKLQDLTGIAEHYTARLNAARIFTVMQFFQADSEYLKRQVFHSKVGEQWFKRLRGYEVDDVPTKLGQVGREWVLGKPSTDESYILPCFQYLCESTGKKLRYNNVDARGVMVGLRLQSGEYWYKRKMYGSSFYTDQEVYRRALYLINQRPKKEPIQKMSITCYELSPSARSQLGLFEQTNKAEWLTQAIDELNERYGTFIISSANSLLGKELVKQKIPFGSTKYFDLLLKRA